MTTIDDYKQAHIDLLQTIVQACLLWFQLLPVYNPLSDTDPQKIAFKQWTADIANTIGGWWADEKQLEDNGVVQGIVLIDNSTDPPTSAPLQVSDFFNVDKLIQISQITQQYAADNEAGFGEWAWVIAALVALWAADDIVKHFTTSAGERQDLLQSTADMAKRLNLSPAQTAALLQNVNASTSSSSITDLLKWGVIAFAGIEIIKSFRK